MIRRIVTAVGLVAGLVLSTLPAVAAEETVIIRDSLDRATLRIDVGTTVTWRNRDDERHRVRSKDGPVRFDSKNLERGESFAFTFTVPGEYPYYDHRNRDDRDYFGTIVVVDDAAGAAQPVAEAEVTIVDDAFGPTRVMIVPGGSVTWLNRGADEHTVSANDLSFDSGSMGPGASYSLSFDAVGEFPYFCQIHPEMRATVVVAVAEATDGEPADAAEAAPAVDDAGAAAAEPGAPTTEGPSIGAALDLLATPESEDSPDIGAALDLLATPVPEDAP